MSSIELAKGRGSPIEPAMGGMWTWQMMEFYTNHLLKSEFRLTWGDELREVAKVAPKLRCPKFRSEID